MATKMDEDKEELNIVAAEQHRELAAARIFVSDLDLAFRLQLEEAMTASLAFQPSSSTSPMKSQRPPILVSDDSDAVNLVDLQTLELDNYEAEIRDRVVIETEKMKFKEDLHRRIHDQKLAREILRMPEDEWEEVGHNFERPYGEGSSSSKSKDNSEVFRVYFKGLLSEERVHGTSSSQKTTTFAGIGVAICDSRDELIFEMRKPLDLIEDDRISRQSVEGKALIEALNAAIALDLKRIRFYCDYYTLYQYVSGRWQPKQAKMKAFVNQIKLLQKSFTYFSPSFVARKDVKFAFKLAREAIDSQINKPPESNNGNKLEHCVICLDDKSTDQFFSAGNCNHRYCFSCMKQHVEVKLLHGIVPKCPHEGCELELKVESCEIFMTPKLIEMMKHRLKEASIPVTEKIYCPYPKCSALMSKTELSKLPRFIHENGARTCCKCHGDFCVNCRVPWHRNMNCAEYKRRNPTPLVDESKLKSLAARNLWRQCIKCKHMIELATGCYHMTCRCGYEFCYTCGAEWKNKKATCTCPLWDEENIVDTDDDDEFDDDDDDDEFDDDEEFDDDYDSDDDEYYF
ncbi:E3 ubiquitin-protein ligase RSL1 [Lactuca sativa]|uniref:RBR-type E3 ubiquitin transferase n=1 Tax=Lactuca sativa TaxID=4236 RepID=A0A9R1XAX8_LACSA|nr:E3 ubiquitin-protein ligase RSL1 [Lactuca sativa]KAJ0201857.1 hypothetical protein LSAT_V11C600308150 [Lactuca sativa]